MTSSAASIYAALENLRLIDPHTHINPHKPASTTLADLLGYHYYTELAHSAGMPKKQIEESGIGPRELVRRLINNLGPLDNTAQYRWLIEICRRFFDFEGDRLDSSNWESVYDVAESKMSSAQWAYEVLQKSNVDAVFLTNDFDDELSGFETDVYIPCLRTDELVFHFTKSTVRERLEACSKVDLDGSLRSLRESLEQRFEHFVNSGARACAISLPPSFSPTPVSDGRASIALDHVMRLGPSADESHRDALSRRMFWTLTELCDAYGLPFDLMIGVNRGVYAEGVYQGQDLYDSRVSLIQYKELFNTFPDVKFPISVLASVTNQELVSYAWIFPNVITNGHWWYSNTPSFIARDAAARLEAVPRTKQIGYYSDAYKLEFVWPKFDMYKRILSQVLADNFVAASGWTQERAIELGIQVLQGNVNTIFPKLDSPTIVESPATVMDDSQDQKLRIKTSAAASTTADLGVSATLAAGAIGVVGVTQFASSAASVVNEGVMVQGFEDQIDENKIDENDSDEEDSDEDGQDLSSSMTVLMDPDEEPIDVLSDDDVLQDLDPTPSQFEFDIDDGSPDQVDFNSDSMTIEEDFAPRRERYDADEIEKLVEGEPLTLHGNSSPDDGDIETLNFDDFEGDELDVGSVLDDYEPTAISDVQPADVELSDVELSDVEPDDVETELRLEDDFEDAPAIEPLRGEGSFQPDADSLRLKPDPITGEWKFSTDDEDRS
jgi:glucuronate isomerase